MNTETWQTETNKRCANDIFIKTEKMNKKLPLYLADLKDSTDRMLALSFVTAPASGLMLKPLEQTPQGLRVFAPILPANMPIYRNNEQYGEHYVMFLPEVIADLMKNTLKNNIYFDFEHDGKPLSGIELIETFQIDYQNGKLYKNYHGLTDGTWCSVLNMVNPFIISKTCPQNILGISISGIFSYEQVSLKDAIEFYRKIKI